MEIFVLNSFQPADNLVGHRREGNLHAHLGDELCKHHHRQLVIGNDATAIKSQWVKKQRVHALCKNG